MRRDYSDANIDELESMFVAHIDYMKDLECDTAYYLKSSNSFVIYAEKDVMCPIITAVLESDFP